jgi:uncharacterized protein (DUF2384 family)
MCKCSSERVNARCDTGTAELSTLLGTTGLTLPEVARFVGVQCQVLEKNPAAPIAQLGLTKLTHAWELLQTVFPSDEAIRKWLLCPIRRFDGRTPKWLLETHGVDAFEGLAKEMTLGTMG